MRSSIYLFFLSFLMSCVLAQTPDTVKKNFNKKYPNATEVSWRVDRNSLREAHFKINDLKYRADFTLSGKWIETERNVKWEDLPEAVKNAFKNEDKEKDIVEIELVDHYEKGSFYDIEYKAGSDKKDIEIRPDGSVIRTGGH